MLNKQIRSHFSHIRVLILNQTCIRKAQLLRSSQYGAPCQSNKRLVHDAVDQEEGQPPKTGGGPLLNSQTTSYFFPILIDTEIYMFVSKSVHIPDKIHRLES